MKIATQILLYTLLLHCKSLGVLTYDLGGIDSVNKKVEALRLSIEKGADFGEVARKESEDKGSAIKGGDLGWFQEGVMVDEFNEACFTSKRLDLSVVTSEFGVHLIQVTKISKSVKKSKVMGSAT